MVSDLEKHLGSTGLGMISPEAGVAALVNELLHGARAKSKSSWRVDLGTLDAPLERTVRAHGGRAMNRGRTCDIALVGMACRFSGARTSSLSRQIPLRTEDVTSESGSESHPSLVNDAVVAALADASMTPESLDRRRVELFIAIAGVLADRPLVRGACYMIDAGSVSSLIAMDLASRALFERRADVSLRCWRSQGGRRPAAPRRSRRRRTETAARRRARR